MRINDQSIFYLKLSKGGKIKQRNSLLWDFYGYFSRRFTLLCGLLFCCVLSAWGQSDEEIAYVDSLNQIVADGSSPSGSVDALNELASFYYKSDLEQATRSVKTAKRMADSLEYQEGQAVSLKILSEIHERIENYAKASDYLMQSIRIQTEMEDWKQLGRSYTVLARLYSDRSMLDQSLEALEKSEEFIDLVPDSREYFRVRHNRAFVLNENNRPDEAAEIYLKNLETLTDSGWGGTFLAVTTNNLGNVYLRRDQYEEALPLFEQALRLKEDENDLFRATSTCNNLARVTTGLERYIESQNYIDKAREYATYSGNSAGIIRSYEIEAELNFAMGNHKKAYEFLERYHEENDSVNEVNKKEAVDNMLMTFKVEEDLNRIELLETENELITAEGEKNEIYLVAAIAVGAFLITLILVLILVTINNRKKNSRLNSYNTQLTDLNEQKDALIQVVAHDLKAPLNKTLGLLEMMDQSGSLTPEQQPFVSMLRRVNEDAGKLVADLLQLNALEAGKVEGATTRFDASELLEEMARAYCGVAEKKRIKISVNKPKAPHFIESQRPHLERVLDNLISNAIKFSPPGKQIWLGLEKKSGATYFSVRDEGPGISPEDQKLMFRKFQKLSARPTAGESSTGLGLSIVKVLTDQLNGTLKVDSQLGEGTTFNICLA